jgi:NAD(P) transhydrogenase subunit alpha
MTIGVLKEGNGENRVVLLPEHVAKLVKKEFTLLVEKGAGLAAHANDASYTRSPELLSRAAPRC